MNGNTAPRLLLAAGVLMLLSGRLFACLRQWLCAVLVWGGALGCLAAALTLKAHKDK